MKEKNSSQSINENYSEKDELIDYSWEEGVQASKHKEHTEMKQHCRKGREFVRKEVCKKGFLFPGDYTSRIPFQSLKWNTGSDTYSKNYCHSQRHFIYVKMYTSFNNSN